MKTLIILLLLAFLALSQTHQSSTNNMPTVQTIQSATDSTPYSSPKAGNSDIWNSQNRQKLKGQHELSDE
jgi:hypothetical protein